MLDRIEAEAEKAKERQGTRTDLEHSGKVTLKFDKTRDRLGSRVGVSGSTDSLPTGQVIVIRDNLSQNVDKIIRLVYISTS